MSKPSRIPKRIPSKALPQAPNKKLPPKPPQLKPRANTYDNHTQPMTTTMSYTQTFTNTGGSGFTFTNTGGTGFTYTTTYESAAHPWAAPSKPLKKIPNKVPQTLLPKTKSLDQVTSTTTTTNISYRSQPSQDGSLTMRIFTQPTGTTTTTKRTKGRKSQRAMTVTTFDRPSKHRLIPSYHAVLPLNHDIVNKDMEYSINDHVDLNDNRKGIIHFIGEISVELNGAIWYGIELTQPKGTNNGTLKGVTYFKCNNNYGTFVERKRIRWISSEYSTSIDIDSEDRYHINQIVKVNGKKGNGQIRFIGLFKNELKYGIELLDDTGNHSGIIDGKFYFTCGIYRGLFVNESDLSTGNTENEEEEKGLTLPLIHIFYRTGDAADESDDSNDSNDSIVSDAESVCSVASISTFDHDVFGQVRLHEDDTDLAFTQILNKYKNIERGQAHSEEPTEEPTDTSVDMAPEDLYNIQDHYDDDDHGIQVDDDYDVVPGQTVLSLQSSKTSLVEEDNMQARYTLSYNGAELDDGGCILEEDDDIDDAYEITGPPPPNKRSHSNPIQHDQAPQSPERSKHQLLGLLTRNKPYDLNKPSPTATTTTTTTAAVTTDIETQQNTNDSYHISGPPRQDTDEKDTYTIMAPPSMKRTVSAKKAPKKMSVVVSMAPTAVSNPSQYRTNNTATIAEDPAVPSMIATESDTPTGTQPITSLTPLGIVSPGDPRLSFIERRINIEDCHLKDEPEGPYDVCTTEREFRNTAQIIQLGCNNPYKLFKILKAMTTKLYVEDMKYRVLSTESNRLRLKLLNYDGVNEFLNQLGFKEHNGMLECPLDQPPVCVLKAATKVCIHFISKCGRRRAIIDTLKKFNPAALSPLPSPIPADISAAAAQAVMEIETEEKVITPVVIHDEDIEIPAQFSQVVEAAASAVTSPQEQEAEALKKTLDAVYEDDDAVVTELEAEDDLDGAGDTFQLYDIIVSMTHEDNDDDSAAEIVLLCYKTFTDALQLFQCLDHRFFSGNWNIQSKVIELIESWMKQYWEQDWGDVMLLMCTESFLKKVQDKYAYGKYKKLIQNLNKTMENKRVSMRNEGNMTPIMSPMNHTMDKAQLRNISVQEFEASYDFMKLSNIKIARQMTFIDLIYFSAIQARECIGQAWKKKNKYEIAKNICAVIDHFNRTAKWVQCRILLTKNAKGRAKIIKKFIKICEHLFILRNFQGLYAIYGALYSSAVMRLKGTWRYIQTKHLAKFEEFKLIFASKKNMSNLRKLHRETYPPMIPYMGIILQDLLSIEEGNKMRRSDGSVNFSRLIRQHTVIESVLNHQKAPYKISPNKKLQDMIKMEMKLNQNISDETIWELSDKARNMDSKKKKNFIMFGAK